MEASNVMAALYFALHASPEQAKALVEKALQCTLDREDSEAYDETIAFSGSVLGIRFTLFDKDFDWNEGHVYKLVGIPLNFEDTKSKTRLDFHVSKLLRAQGITYVLDQQEFNAEYRRRKKGSSPGNPT